MSNSVIAFVGRNGDEPALWCLSFLGNNNFSTRVLFPGEKASSDQVAVYFDPGADSQGNVLFQVITGGQRPEWAKDAKRVVRISNPKEVGFHVRTFKQALLKLANEFRSNCSQTQIEIPPPAVHVWHDGHFA